MCGMIVSNAAAAERLPKKSVAEERLHTMQTKTQWKRLLTSETIGGAYVKNKINTKSTTKQGWNNRAISVARRWKFFKGENDFTVNWQISVLGTFHQLIKIQAGNYDQRSPSEEGSQLPFLEKVLPINSLKGHIIFPSVVQLVSLFKLSTKQP